MKMRHVPAATREAVDTSVNMSVNLRFFSFVLALYSLLFALWLWNFTRMVPTPLLLTLWEILMSSADMVTSRALAILSTASLVEAYAPAGIPQISRNCFLVYCSKLS